MRTKIIIGTILAAGSLLSVANVSRADPPSGSGWDTNGDVVVGGGSDTTYLVSQRLEVLFNGAPGCQIDTAEGVNKGACIDSTAPPTGVTNGNYDHDVFVGAAPTGSGAGVDALRSCCTQNNPNIDFARSSSGPNAARLADLTYWGYARDAIAVVTFGTRSNACLTQQNLKDIYASPALKTDWSQLNDCTGNPLAAGPIIAWGMNTASGTNASFKAYVAPSNPDVTGRKLLSTGLGPFENDVKPILSDPGPDGIIGNADDDENNYIWWMSYGNWAKYPFTKNGKVDGTGAAINSILVGLPVAAGGFATPDDAGITNGTYAILRTLYHVTRNTEADCRTVGSTTVPTTACDNDLDGAGPNPPVPVVFGAVGGKGGAVREFTQWMCRQSNTQHAVNPVTGKGYRTEITNATNAEGFQIVPTSLRTAGYWCSVST